ncbi:MAG: hypothetical protein JRD84_00915 [Deltaproteobacteria bacterium]|nr:hypothetical protein [Deltaproteobacteria bacterium]
MCVLLRLITCLDIKVRLHRADYISLVTGQGYESDDCLHELEEGTMDYLDFDDNDISDLTLALMESVAKM